MESKFTRFIKSFFIIMCFLIINILIDAVSGSTVPMVISTLKTGNPLDYISYIAYGLLAGQLIKALILVFFIRKRRKTLINKYQRPYIFNEKLENPLSFVGIGLGTVGFGLILTNLIMKAFEGSEMLGKAIELMENAFSAQRPIDKIIMMVTIAIGAPLVEELLFRGVLFEELNRHASKKTTIFLTALIFGLYHFNIIQSPNTFMMGLILAYVYNKTKSIKAPIIVHATNNLLATIPMVDQGLSWQGIILYGIFLIIGIYSLKTLS